MKLLVIIPTYDEAENIKKLLPEVVAVLPENGGILIVDDGSPDGTAKIAAEIANNISDSKNTKIQILERTEKSGLGTAYIAGFNWGIKNGFDVFLEMDADFSHKPEYIPELYKQIEKYDVAIGSRYVKGGGVEGWTLLRKIISRGGSLYARFVLGVKISDLTGGFNMWRLSALQQIGLDKIFAKGYLFQIEMKSRAIYAGCSACEVPIIFPDRQIGISKMSGGIFKEALFGVWKLREVLHKEKTLQKITLCEEN